MYILGSTIFKRNIPLKVLKNLEQVFLGLIFRPLIYSPMQGPGVGLYVGIQVEKH